MGEYEIGQAKVEIERLQARIERMVEDQADVISRERVLIEKHFQNQVQNMREELERQATELGKSSAEIEQRKGVEHDLLRQLADKEQSIEKSRAELEKVTSSYRAENCDLVKLKQKLEVELSGVRLDLENSHRVHSAESNRLQEEIRNIKSGLTSNQETLAACRQECLNLSEIKATLEREVNHLRVRGPLPLTLDEFPTREAVW